MDALDLSLAVPLTARLSALLFATALIVPAALPRAQRQRLTRASFVAFIIAHTIHFCFVSARVLATGGKGMFPGGRDVADAGGLPAVFAVFAFFYAVAGLALAGRLAGESARAGLRWASRGATVFLGYMFVSTYLPLVARSSWYVLPAVIVTLAVAIDLFSSRFRRLICMDSAEWP
jgi:hypothetical protein